MNVRELIAALSAMPPGAEVRHLWDGEARTAIECVWLSRDGVVVTSDLGMVCYSVETRPEWAQSDEFGFWSTPDRR